MPRQLGEQVEENPCVAIAELQTHRVEQDWAIRHSPLDVTTFKLCLASGAHTFSCRRMGLDFGAATDVYFQSLTCPTTNPACFHFDSAEFPRYRVSQQKHARGQACGRIDLLVPWVVAVWFGKTAKVQ